MIHEHYMRRCFHLAEMGKGSVAPNPMVGAVIVHNEKIIGEGYHKAYGHAHAEVNAIDSVQDKKALAESTLYVNLEPCVHFGKTPPCADLIIEHRIPHVVVGCIDPFSEVSGKGIAKLRNAGTKVEVGIMEKEAKELNRRFFTFHHKKRPYIVLKWAQSRDGFMDIERKEGGEVGPHWITQLETMPLVHQWRSEEEAVLVGKNTVVNDDPHLTVRAVSGRNPLRVVIDPKDELNLRHYYVGDGAVRALKIKGLSNGLNDITDSLYTANIHSVLVEGGRFTLQQFIDANLWDEVRILTGISTLGKGLAAPAFDRSAPSEQKQYGKDTVDYYVKDWTLDS